MAELEVVPVALEDTYDLRRRILREGTPSDEVRFPEDEWAGTFHLGVRDGRGRLLAVATFCARPTPYREGRAAVQLRGMAVDEDRQGTGVGRQLLRAAMDGLRREGFTVLWAHARDTAVPFYERLGLDVVGDGFVARDTRLPHHNVVGDL